MKQYFIVLVSCMLSKYSVAQQYGSFKDPRDRIVYKTVKIGSQIWMAENLQSLYFRNGDPIPIAKNDYEWSNANKLKQPACCYYQNNGQNGIKLGVLYNWYAVVDSRGLAPEGWSIPSYYQYKLLVEKLGGDSVATSKLKSRNGWLNSDNYILCKYCKDWAQEKKVSQVCIKCKDTRINKLLISGNGSNESGFSGLPGGMRFFELFKDSISFADIGKFGFWWSSSDDSYNHAWTLSLSFVNNRNRIVNLEQKGYGFSIRCLLNSSFENKPLPPSQTSDRELTIDNVAQYGILDEDVHSVANSSNSGELIFEKVDVEASFPGGEVKWRQFLEDKLGLFNPADEGAPSGTYKVYVQFIVDKEGKISDVRALTNHGYKMEERVVDALINAPLWVPASINGRKVKAYRKQPITFRVEDAVDDSLGAIKIQLPPTKENILYALESFRDKISKSPVSIDGARSILNYLGSTETEIFNLKSGAFLIGKISDYSITIWIEPYGKTDRYGVRYGLADLKYQSSNLTYFEIIK